MNGWRERLPELRDWLLRGDPAIQAHIAGKDDQERRHRLRLYADAYRLRLLEVLAQDYPALRAWVGEARFERLGNGYLVRHPSRTASVRGFGAALASWLQANGQAPAEIALARFEWAQGEVFDAAEASPCEAATLMALAPAQWPGLRFSPVPAARRLDGIGNAPVIAAALAAGEPPPAWDGADTPYWLWRQGHDVHWRPLAADEAALWSAMTTGEGFAAGCALLAGPRPALRAAGLLNRWLADGLVAAIHLDDPPSQPAPGDRHASP